MSGSRPEPDRPKAQSLKPQAYDMADLLECLLQIKALRETADRVNGLAATVDAARWTEAPPERGASPADLLAEWVDLEVVYGAWLRLMLASAPVLPALDDGAFGDVGRRHHWSLHAAVDRFLRYRYDNLELLDGCSADDLARTALHASRRQVTLADLIARWLASDVDRFAAIRRALA